MSKYNNSINRRLRAYSLSTVISMALVLFMLGIVGLILLTSEKLSVIVKENIGFSVYLKENAREVDIIRMQKNLETAAYVKTTEYISKQEAVNILRKELDPDENFIAFLEGYNPLPASIDVMLDARYANTDSLARIENDLKKTDIVSDIVYSKSLVHLVNENVKKISLFILLFCTLLFIIAVALINNTIRLSIYSKRFLIKTMQLVGATKRFIRKPFLIIGISQGLYAALIAIGLLSGFLYLAERKLPDLIKLQDTGRIIALFLVVLALGFIISWSSTLLAVKKYLKTKTNDLYY